MTDVLAGVVSALVAVVLTLAAVIRFYLPRAVNRHNPGSNELHELLKEVRAMREADGKHHAREEQWQENVTQTLGRIEGRLP